MSKKNKKNKSKHHQHHQGGHHPAVKQPTSFSTAVDAKESTGSGEGFSQEPRERSLEQQRAADALLKVKALRGQSGYYVSYVSALPAIIVMNGLGQALTMLLAKSKGMKSSEHYLLYSHIASWLSARIVELRASEVDDVIQKLMEGNQDVYIRAQTEVMAYLQWLKQFARAYLKEKEGDE